MKVKGNESEKEKVRGNERGMKVRGNESERA